MSDDFAVALELRHLGGGYGDTQVVFDIDARIRPGEILGVVGRNGVGKTTLARLIQGGLPATTGEIRLGGHSITTRAPHQRRQAGLGYMPQTGMVFDDLTVRENLSLGQTRIAPDACFALFPRLAERLDQPAGTMSGGERKILAFVRTLIETTTVLVLDEPSEGVQPENIGHMARCLKDRAAEGAAIILLEQNLGFLRQVADHIMGLDSGRVVLDRPAAETSPEDLRKVLAL